MGIESDGPMTAAEKHWYDLYRAKTEENKMLRAEAAHRREVLCEIANRASNMMDKDAADWMPSIYKLAVEEIGDDPWRLLGAAGFTKETMSVSFNQQTTVQQSSGQGVTNPDGYVPPVTTR